MGISLKEKKGNDVGLLDLFKGRAKEAPPQPVKPPEAPSMVPADYAHLRVEVTAFDGRLLFVAKLMYPMGNTAELHQYFDSVLPEDTEPVQVRIRGYHPASRKAVYMEGLISPQPKHIWKVENLVVARVGNDRAFFRLDTDIDAHITKFSGRNAGEMPCKMLNISVGGVCIAAKQRYWEGDKLLLNVQLSEDRDNSVMFCQVLRVIEKEDGTFQYGCQFLELTEADEGKITQNIFDIQRKMRNGSK